MSSSPLTSETDLPTFKILVDGNPMKDFYQVVSIRIEKEINKISTAHIVLMDGDASAENFPISESDDFIPGKSIEIQMGYHATDSPVYKGVIMGQQIKVKSGATRLVSVLTVKCSDKALKLTVTKNNVTFKDKKDSDVITSILATAGITKTVDATDFQYPKIVQYDCTDWDFILSRAEMNGFVVVCNDGALTIGKPDFSAAAVLSLTYGKDVVDFNADLDAQHQIASVSCKSWDNSKLAAATGVSVEPTVNAHGNLTGKKLSDVLGTGTYNMHTTVPEDASVLKTWANAKLQQSRLSKIRGTVSFVGNSLPLPGKIIELNGFGQRMNGSAYISKVEHVFEAGNWLTHVGFGMHAKSFAESKQLLSPPAMGLLPGIQGLQIGVVKQLDQDPDGEFRILVTVPMIEEAGDGIWARLAHEYASNEIGTFFLPEIGDEVVLGFLNEDPRFPVIMGMLYSKTKTPPYTPAAENNTKAIITKSKLKLIFDEEKKIITIETPGANKIIISDDGKSITLQDQNSNKVVLSDSGISLDSPKDITVSAKGKFSVDAMGITLNSKADVTVEGNNINAKAKMAFAAQGTSQASLKATGQVEVKGGMVMIN
jgi:Rhs element Vgr protein